MQCEVCLHACMHVQVYLHACVRRGPLIHIHLHTVGTFFSSSCGLCLLFACLALLAGAPEGGVCLRPEALRGVIASPMYVCMYAREATFPAGDLL